MNAHGMIGVFTLNGANVNGKIVGPVNLAGVTTISVSGGTVSFLPPDGEPPAAVALPAAVLVTLEEVAGIVIVVVVVVAVVVGAVGAVVVVL